MKTEFQEWVNFQLTLQPYNVTITLQRPSHPEKYPPFVPLFVAPDLKFVPAFIFPDAGPVLGEERVEHHDVQYTKDKDTFRNYEDSYRHDVVYNHYRLMRTHQTYAFSKRMSQKYSFQTPRARMSVSQAFRLLEGYVDSSDPDVSLPNFVHMLQTAEGIRKAGHSDWFQVIGLIHDMGKIMFLWGSEEDGQNGTATGQQWALGGDTWVTGCKIPDCAVLPEFNKLNPDMHDSNMNTELGIYSPHCGMHNLQYAYGHDEYLYQMLVHNATTLPPEGLAMIRFHSCYPWHSGGAYRQFMNQEDHNLLQWVLEFNKFDLYTKEDGEDGLKNFDMESLWSYYQGLLDKFNLGGDLDW